PHPPVPDFIVTAASEEVKNVMIRPEYVDTGGCRGEFALQLLPFGRLKHAGLRPMVSEEAKPVIFSPDEEKTPSSQIRNHHARIGRPGPAQRYRVGDLPRHGVEFHSQQRAICT